MPEQQRPPRGHAPLLSTVHDNNALIRACCGGCSPARWYVAADLMRLYGNIALDSLARRMKCGVCGNRLDIQVVAPTAAERNSLRIRRLDRVWTVRRASWRVE